ncbi:MAG: sensor domain-containing diguanylate cyclase [Candidatus Omnitrophica bacterium]|nr:sensor domain-containing diguanylate cyclase [Candidatus Omnitrophota bacterium]
MPVFFLQKKLLSSGPFFLFYLINLTFIIISANRVSKRKFAVQYESQKIEEGLNVLSADNLKEDKHNINLQQKTIRYNSLKEIIEELNQRLDVDFVAGKLSGIVFSLLAANKGACLLYLVDNQTQRLSLFKTKKENSGMVVKAKEGDMFDLWVLRHTSPLLVEDAKKDFRFDLDKFKKDDSRQVESLISSPLVSGQKLIGILRLDSPVKNAFSQDDLRFLATVCEIGAVALENSQLFQKTRDLAIHDGLTSLYTKGYFLERLKEECRRALRHGSELSLLMLDIDFFKNYNDKFGHSAGDIVLKNLTRLLNESSKGEDAVLGRFGGEEFCVILKGKDKKDALIFADGLRQKIEGESVTLRRERTSITVSIGVASFPPDTTDENDLVRKADAAMYEAKKKGRNQVCCI